MSLNSGGGYTFSVDAWQRFERWLLLGSEGGSFYASEQKLTTENTENTKYCIASDGLRAVKMIRDTSLSGRAAKNDPALYALALAASSPNQKTSAAALDALQSVARIGTHLFTFAEFVDELRGWGPALRRAVQNWYVNRSPEKLAYQLCKYQQRNGWSHKDLLRLSHLHSNEAIFRWVLGADMDSREVKRTTKINGTKVTTVTQYPAASGTLPEFIHAFEAAKTADEKTLIRLIRKYNLTREMIPTEHQKSPAVWEALLENMPLGAMVRTLGRMSAVGLFGPMSDSTKIVLDALQDGDAIKQQRLHPIGILTAMLTYKQGKGIKGDLTWKVNPQIVDALDGAFYEAFHYVEPSGKNFFLGVDVSGSMTGGVVAGVPGMTPNMGAAAMAMVMARTEPNHFIGGFSHHFVDLGITKNDKLPTAMKKAQRDFGATDCSVAIAYALKNKIPVDAFVIISDNEANCNLHASQELIKYREKTGISAKLISMNLVANGWSVADPTDVGSLNVLGFDAAVPAIISSFAGGNTFSVESED